MLRVYAIDPGILATWERCKSTLNLMGFQHGRAIAGYPTPKRWRDLAKAAFRANANVGDWERLKLFEKLTDSMRKAVWSNNWNYDDDLGTLDERWLSNAIVIQDKCQPFHAILSTRNPTAHPEVVLERDVDESHEKFLTSREVPVLRQPSELCEHVKVLVTNSKSLVLIDPHIDPSNPKWRPIIGACLELASRPVRDEIKMTVDIHCLYRDDKPSLEFFRSSFFKHICPLIPRRLKKVHVHRWRKKRGGPHDFHGRYILTERGGYGLDKGLDTEHGREQPMSLLGDIELERLLRGYATGSHAFFDEADDFELAAPTKAAL